MHLDDFTMKLLLRRVNRKIVDIPLNNNVFIKSGKIKQLNTQSNNNLSQRTLGKLPITLKTFKL